MLHKWFLTGRRRKQLRPSVLRRSVFEQLETRAMFAATPVGDRLQFASTTFAPFATTEAADMVIRSNGISTVAYDGRGSSDRQGIFLQQIGANGVPVANSLTLANSTVRGEQFNPALASAENGSYMVVWSGRGAGDRQGIFAQRYDATGNRVGAEFRVNQTTGGDQLLPAVAMAPNGQAIVVWQGVGTGDFDGIYARRIGTDGQPVGDEIKVNTNTAGEQATPSVSMDDTGEFVVAWSSRGQDGSGWGIFAQQFTAAGVAAGAEFRVNTTTANSQIEPSVSMNGDSEFVVAWSSLGAATAGWDIMAQRYNSEGQSVGTEFRINQDSAGDQREADVALADAGELLVTWSHAGTTGTGWDVRARTFNDADAADGNDVLFGAATDVASQGNQRDPVAWLAADGNAFVLFQNANIATQTSLVAQQLDVDVQPAANVAPDILEVAEQNVSVGNSLDIVVTASDANRNDTLTFRLDTAVSPASATITRISNTTARIQWTPVAADRGQRRGFRVIVEDNGTPLLSDAAQFFVNVNNAAPVLDLNGTNGTGNDFTTTFNPTGNAVAVVDSDLVITDLDHTQLSSAVATLIPVRDGANEVLAVVTTGTSITASYNSTTGALTLSGTDTLANYQQVLRTLTYDNNATDPNQNERRVEIRVNDGTANSAVATATITIIGAGTPSAVNDAFTISEDATVQALNVLANDSAGPGQGVELTISAVSAPSKGSTAVIDNVSDRILYTPAATAEGTETFTYTIRRPNGATSTATVTITLDGSNDAPTLAALPNVTVRAGSPLHIALDAEDADGDTLTFSATSSNATLVSPTVLTGNRSLRLAVENFGEMVFELFEDKAPRATNQIISLAQSGFYEGIIFHRVINNFVIQGGDPTGTGTSGSTLGDFDDQFHIDLQHNATGQLSMAKSQDDTNDSQFFITEGPQRHLDSNHTVFGQLVEGESVRDAISNVPTNASSGRPNTNVVIDTATVFVDNENGVLMLKAPEGTTGTATVSVTVTDSTGASTVRQFTVTVVADNNNSPPWLADIPTITTPVNTARTFQLTAVDVEGDSVVFLDEDRIDSINADTTLVNKLPVPVRAPANLDYSVNPTTGLLTITPTNGLTGTHRLVVATAASLTGLSGTSAIDYQVITVTIG